MKKFFPYYLILWMGLACGHAFAAAPSPSPPGLGESLTGTKWKELLAQFEESVSTLSTWLEKTQAEKKQLQSDIEKLEEKTAALRRKTKNNSNVFDEIKLKGLLNDLKKELERNSALQHQWDDKQKEFEQKALSLLALYNDRIEAELASDPAADAARLDQKLSDLNVQVQKRNQVRVLLKQYQRKNDNAQSLPVASFQSLKTNDRESLQLTLDLLRDRKKEMEEQIEKCSLEEEEVKNELKLQGKMQEFLEDIHRINVDSDHPHGASKRNDLEGMVGKSQKNKLESRLAALREKAARAQQTLAQIAQLTLRIQHQMDTLNERKRK